MSNVSITGSGGSGGNQFIVSPLTVTLENPSDVSLSTVDISLPVVFNDVKIGRAVISSFKLVPGQNVLASEFHYEPDNANDTVAQNFITEFLTTGNDIGLAIHGDGRSSPFVSLKTALSSLSLTTSLKGSTDNSCLHYSNTEHRNRPT